MTRRLTEAQRIARLDIQKWEASFAFVRAYNEWEIAQKEFGPFSLQAQEKFVVARRAVKDFRRMSKKK